ncbi:DUF6950 family protein [Vibrio nigripulchritudo]|uniref:DUF6950 family protein n=1 Tax=Vibrio nigripulchritudo TaxID=28173 RepID=UPI0003B234D2|nr:hypothetical protein VIBNISFn118_150047 [Vibrio nigripulchritudo SFn118]
MEKCDQLNAFLQEQSQRCFVWGTSDCALLAADWVNTRTGHDPAKAFRGHYHSQKSSLEALKQQGQKNLIDAVESAMGEPLSGPMLAQRGDIVVVETENGPACGIMSAQGVVVQGQSKLVMVSISKALKAWRVM